MNTNPAKGWYGDPAVNGGRLSGFRDRDMPLALFCHECETEYPDHERLDARDIGGTHVFLSCPSCKRDLASVELPAPAPGPGEATDDEDR